jgi:hypothetical protein
MEKPNYPIDSFENELFHFFDSIGNEIVTKKVVAFYTSKENEQVYRLILGDVLDDGNIDIYSTSQNNDMEMILTTVIKTIEKFFIRYPDKIVTFTGSTPARTRLYRAVISKFVNNDDYSYKIYGIKSDNDAELFQNNHSYIGYLILKDDGNNN